MMKFNLAEFENAFYSLLFRDYNLDIVSLDRKFFYRGLTLRVIMADSVIDRIIDIRAIEPKIIYRRGSK